MIYGSGRGSVVFGDMVVAGTDLNDPYFGETDEVLAISEVEIGVEYIRQLSGGSSVLLRAGYEGQIWHEAGSPNVMTGAAESIGFEGFSFALGFMR